MKVYVVYEYVGYSGQREIRKIFTTEIDAMKYIIDQGEHASVVFDMEEHTVENKE